MQIESQAVGVLGKKFDAKREIQTKLSPFLALTLELPPPPLFQDELEANIIPQVSLLDLLSKYDGKTIQDIDNVLKRHVLKSLPFYLILILKRFTKSGNVEKNPTIVNFPIKGLDMRECKLLSHSRL